MLHYHERTHSVPFWSKKMMQLSNVVPLFRVWWSFLLCFDYSIQYCICSININDSKANSCREINAPVTVSWLSAWKLSLLVIFAAQACWQLQPLGQPGCFEGCLHARQRNLETFDWPVDHSGLETFWFSSPVHADAHFLLFYISFKSIYCLHAAAAATFFEPIILIYNKLISSPPFSALALCLSPGFSSVPEDLLPDFDLKIMPGRGVISSPPYLVLYFSKLIQLAALTLHLEWQINH